jgi:peptidoglycan LD-endopeptidase CwlK
MTLALDARSLATLKGVHPDLIKVVTLAYGRATAQPFEVIQGLRTVAEEAADVARGASTTMHSRHLAGKAGFACAVDLAAMDDGHISWDAALYQTIAIEMKTAAAALGIPIEWGGDWSKFKDMGHFQLPWAQYP